MVCQIVAIRGVLYWRDYLFSAVQPSERKLEIYAQSQYQLFTCPFVLLAGHLLYECVFFRHFNAPFLLTFLLCLFFLLHMLLQQGRKNVKRGMSMVVYNNFTTCNYLPLQTRVLLYCVINSSRSKDSIDLKGQFVHHRSGSSCFVPLLHHFRKVNT